MFIMYKDKCDCNKETPETNFDSNQGANYPGVVCPPIYECPQEKVCHRYICHEVPHIMPCNTRIINHHIYRHVYTPCYTCCEENVVSNVYGPKCGF